MLQNSAAVYTKRTNGSAMRLRDQVFVRDANHLIQHAKFKAADQLSDWMLYNPKNLSYRCNLTSCNLLWAPLLVFVGFRDHYKGVGGLVSEWRAKLGTLKSNCVDKIRGESWQFQKWLVIDGLRQYFVRVPVWTSRQFIGFLFVSIWWFLRGVWYFLW